LNRCHFQRFVLTQRRQQTRQAAGEQGLAGAGRAAEQQVMRACRSDQQCAFGGELALDFAEVRVRFVQVQQTVGLEGLDRHMPIQVRHHLQQVVHRNHLQPRCQAGLFGIRPGHDHAASGLARCERCRQHTFHCAYLAR